MFLHHLLPMAIFGKLSPLLDATRAEAHPVCVEPARLAS